MEKVCVRGIGVSRVRGHRHHTSHRDHEPPKSLSWCVNDTPTNDAAVCRRISLNDVRLTPYTTVSCGSGRAPNLKYNPSTHRCSSGGMRMCHAHSNRGGQGGVHSL